VLFVKAALANRNYLVSAHFYNLFFKTYLNQKKSPHYCGLNHFNSRDDGITSGCLDGCSYFIEFSGNLRYREKGKIEVD